MPTSQCLEDQRAHGSLHTDNAKRKLRVTTRIQAVTEAVRLGLIKL